MSANYIELIGDYYPNHQVSSTGDPSDYNSLIWEVGDQISIEELYVVFMTDLMTKKALALSEEAHLEITTGFESSALGSPFFYDAQHEDQLNLVGSVSTGADMPYACREALQAKQTIDVGGAITGTESTSLQTGVSYSANVKINGVSHMVYIQGDNATNYNDLVIQIQNDINGYGVCELVSGNIVIKSNTVGSSSSIEIINNNLFDSLQHFVGINSPIQGVDAINGPKAYVFHTHEQLVQVINDGKDVKLYILQKFNIKYNQILQCTTEEEINAITWND